MSKKWMMLTSFTLLILSVNAQIPDQFTNLKVLPEDISKRELVTMMKGFTSALGVRCEHCHLGEAGQPLSSFDFASDERKAKQTAREMIKLVRAINKDHISALTHRSEFTLEVGCVTCHHGQPLPQTLKDLLEREYSSGGVAGVIAKYKALRGENYGNGSYDFSEKPLRQMASGLAQKGQWNEAVQLLQTNLSFFPESGFNHHLLGEFSMRQGNKEMALTHFKKALELDPGNQRAKTMVEQLESP